jgi:hypothetical protein
VRRLAIALGLVALLVVSAVGAPGARGEDTAASVRADEALTPTPAGAVADSTPVPPPTPADPLSPSATTAAAPVVASEPSPSPPPVALVCPFGAIRLFDSGRAPSEDDPVIASKKRAWEATLGGEIAARPQVRARMRGLPTRFLADRATLPTDDRALVERIARDTWTGLDALTDRENGLPVDHVRLMTPPESGATEWRVGDYTNITNVGLHLIAIAAAYELDLLPETDAMERVRRILDTLDTLETEHGLFFNYYDTTSLERTSNFLSFVDTSWLTAGLIVVRMTFAELAERASKLIERTDYGFFYDDERREMSHGYYVQRHARSRYHYGVLYTEARLGNLIAIGKGDVPEDPWFSMVRTYPPDCAGQTQTPAGVTTKTVRGHTFTAGHYEWGGVSYVPSWGGSMFEALMPALVLDEQRHAPRSLGANDVAHATVQRRYAAEELDYPVWGMSPSATPGADDYGEYGVRVLGSRGYRPGAVTPHAAGLALLVTPTEAIADLRALIDRYDVYGEYGFYDAVEPKTGDVAPAYLALDQSMLFIAAANYLKPHCIQERFAADPIVQRALPVIGAEDFFD